MTKKRKILAITGIRSEYDILYPVINALREDKRFEVKIVVSGAHLSSWHGTSLNNVEKDGFVIADKIDSLLMTNRLTQRPKGLGMLLSSFSQTLEREKPDFILVIGDREESMAAAIAGNYMNTLTVHIAGGDLVYGNADDPVRFAVSSLAHVHCTMCRKHKENLLRMGEEKFRVFWTGNPSFENIKAAPYKSMDELSSFLNFDIEKSSYAVIINHPLSSEEKNSFIQMRILTNALEEFCQETDLKAVGIYPNTDPGAPGILKIIEKSAKSKRIKFFRNLPRDMFINLLRNAMVLIGNSSMGFLESPFYKIPVINAGQRQKGRLNAGNVKFVKHDKKEIKKALYKACSDGKYREHIRRLSNPYLISGKKSSERIREILLSIDIKDKKWYIKKRFPRK